MSMYVCNICNKLKNSDFEVCHEDPEDDMKVICESCNEDIEALKEATAQRRQEDG